MVTMRKYTHVQYESCCGLLNSRGSPEFSSCAENVKSKERKGNKEKNIELVVFAETVTLESFGAKVYEYVIVVIDAGLKTKRVRVK